MKRCDKKSVFRAKFSSITDKDIVAAMNSLGEPDENQSRSVDARLGGGRYRRIRKSNMRSMVTG